MKSATWVAAAVAALFVVVLVAVRQAARVLWLTVSAFPLDRRLSLEQVPFRSGDLLLMSGYRLMGGVGAAVIKLATACAYTHAALVYRDPRTRHFYVFEMSLGSGAYLAPLEQCIRGYNGIVVWRGLVTDRAEEERERERRVDSAVHSLLGTPYDADVWYMACDRLLSKVCGTHLPRLHVGERRGLFCTELLTQTWHRAGYLAYAPRTPLPPDFVSARSGHSVDLLLPWRDHAHLGPEFVLKL